MYIENARICDVTIVPTSDVTIVPTRYGMELELTLELQEGELYTHTFNMVTPIEDIATLCDVVGVQSYGELINTPIRVVIPDYGYCQIIGNVTDNKWVDLEGFTFMYLQPELLTTEKERKQKMKTKHIYAILKVYEDRLRQRRLDPDYIKTLVEQAEYLITRETDTDCMKYITETFVEKISEHFYLGLNAKQYVNQVSDAFGIALTRDREIAMRAIGIVVIAGCTCDYPSITNQ